MTEFTARCRFAAGISFEEVSSYSETELAQVHVSQFSFSGATGFWHWNGLPNFRRPSRVGCRRVRLETTRVFEGNGGGIGCGNGRHLGVRLW